MDDGFRFKYETLRALLNKNGQALQIMSDLEADLNHMHHYDSRIKYPIQRLFTRALLMAQELNLMTRDHYSDLYDVIFTLAGETDKIFSSGQVHSPGGEQSPSEGSNPEAHAPLVLPLSPGTDADVALAGGKARGVWKLGQHFDDLTLPGFVITTAAYDRILRDNGIQDRIRLLLNDMDVIEDPALFQARTRTIRRLIRSSTIGKEIETAINRQADAVEQTAPTRLWAVRSSAVGEDSVHSFAGQFDTALEINRQDLVKAYLGVLASRFTDRAVRYRTFHQFREIDTPMAVLFMPMVDAAAAGTLHTRDIKAPRADTMVISAVPGLANRMVAGEEPADTYTISKGRSPEILDAQKVTTENNEYITREQLLEIARTAGEAVDRFGHELDIEWAVDKEGKIRFLQARPLNLTWEANRSTPRPSINKDRLPVLETGITIFPGRAEGPLVFLAPGESMVDVPEGAVVLVEQARPELGTILPKIAALLVMDGSPVAHLATLARECSVPSIFKIGKKAHLLAGKKRVSVNATRRTVYEGGRWPGIRERVRARIAAGNRHEKKSGPLYDLVLALNLLDPDAGSFKATACTSVHDVLRFIHEMSVRSMFGFGDSQTRGWKNKSKKLITDLPLKCHIIDLDNSTPETVKKASPEEVKSVPFQALWRGIADERLFWPERWEARMRGLPADFTETVLGGNRGPRRSSANNYAIVARDYMNLNARFNYHYAMVDAMVGPGTENNHVHFRFRGGGASDDNRTRRAKFLERVLRQEGFGVDRRNDLLTAWFRRYPREASESALEVLGRLMVCARQLDAILKTDTGIREYADAFLKEEFRRFV